MTDKLKALREQVMSLSREGFAKLVGAHSDDSSPICKYGCGGKGWFRYDVPVGHSLFGKVKECRCTLERRALANDARLAQLHSQLTDTEKTWTLENWIGKDEHARRMIYGAMNDGFGVYYLWSSEYGTGKSGLLAAVTNTMLGRGIEVKFIALPDLLDELRDGYRDGRYAHDLEYLKRVPVLCLDEFGRYYKRQAHVSNDEATSWADEKIFQVIDWRYRDFTNLLTVIASNFAPDRGDSNPIASRFGDALRVTVVKVEGTDLRPTAAQLENT